MNRRSALILVLSCSLASAFGAEVPAPAKFEAVRSFIQEGIRREQAPSVAVAVIQDDEVVWAEGFADLERHRPATADSIYLLASVSKPITPTGLMLLVDQGRVELDAPVNGYMPASSCVAEVSSWDGRSSAEFSPVQARCARFPGPFLVFNEVHSAGKPRVVGRANQLLR